MLQYEDGVVYAEKPAGRFTIGLTGFFLFAFVLSWAGAAPMVLASWLGLDATEAQRAFLATIAPLQIFMLFGTLIAALLVALVNYGWRGLKDIIGSLFRFRVSPIWYFLALVLPPAISIAGPLLARHIDPSLPPFAATLAMLAATAQIFAIYLIVNTEEIAWRGYALPQLQRTMSPLTASLFLSVIWGVFHAPLFLMKGGHPAGYSLALFALLVISIGLIAGLLFNATRGSVLLCHLLHQSLNAWGEGMRVFPVMNDGSPWPFRMMVFILAGFGVMAAITLFLRRRQMPNL